MSKRKKGQNNIEYGSTSSADSSFTNAKRQAVLTTAKKRWEEEQRILEDQEDVLSTRDPWAANQDLS